VQYAGRLEVLAGATTHHEIRFVRLPGKADQLILGRDAGPSPQYVGLGSTTVSRRHARFAFTDGCWTIENLSQTNPVVVNDDELTEIDGERPLIDGDRLELGEVVLRFHAR
jgi:pSer/pThr/pTyr-binding forkhead associated (FHA) protein